jgi:hypothetical protein
MDTAVGFSLCVREKACRYLRRRDGGELANAQLSTSY